MARAPHRPVFDVEITEAHYRWEFLRRNAKYRRAIDRWLRLRCQVTESGVILPPFDFRKTRQYRTYCRRWGLRLLIHYHYASSEEAMATFPVFADTPSRQHVVKDPEALRKRVGRPPTSDRDLRRYFRKERIEKGPFQLATQRKHLGKFDLYLTVFDLVHPPPMGEGKTFRQASRRLGIKRISTVKMAYAAACREIRVAEVGLKFSTKHEQEITLHDCSTCAECMKAKTTEQLCRLAQLPKVPRYSREKLISRGRLDPDTFPGWKRRHPRADHQADLD